MLNKIFNFKDFPEIKEVFKLTAKILKLVYYTLIVAIIIGITFLIREWGILTLLLTILGIITPFFIGFVIAWLFNPLVKKLENKGLNRVVSSIIVYLFFLLIIYIFFSTLIPTVYEQLIDFLGTMPELLSKGEGVINNLFSKLDKGLIDAESVKQNMIDVMAKYGNNMVESLPKTVISSFSSILSGIGTFGLSVILGFYILFDFEKIKEHFVHLLPQRYHFEVEHFMNTAGVELRKSVNGTLFVAGIVFLGTAFGFIIIGLKAPLLFAIFCGLTDLIPYIGPLIGGVVAIIVGFSQSSVIGILTLVIVFIVQQLENLVIQPIVMSKSTKLHPVTIIIGLLIFGYYYGIIGMMIATPILTVSKVLYRFIVAKFDLFDYD